MPGDDPHKIHKAASLGVDCICMDIEDGVALNRKDVARQTIAESLHEINFGNTERLVRLNAMGTVYFEDDLAAILPAQPDGIVIPKVEDSHPIQLVSKRIEKLEKKHEWQTGKIILIAIVETPSGILNLREICQADPRLRAIIFGAEDLAVGLGIPRTPEGWEVFHARAELVLHCAAFGLQAIDMVNNDYRDLEALDNEARQGAALGYCGKQVIHPNQVPVVQLAFTPPPKEIAWAKEIVELYESQQNQGKGAVGVKGRLVDMPVYRQAQNILARANIAKNT
jgi:citrate lyase beta subunit